jgi:RNA-splicing ligase RtcB
MSKPPISETIRAKLEEYEVERRIDELAQQTEQLVEQGRARAGALAREHRDDIARFLDKAADAVDRRTDGRHASRIGQVRLQLERGVDRLADQDPDGE